MDILNSDNWFEVDEISTFTEDLYNNNVVDIDYNSKMVRLSNYAGFYKYSLGGEPKEVLILPLKIKNFISNTFGPEHMLENYNSLFSSMFEFILKQLSEHLLFTVSPSSINTTAQLSKEHLLYKLYVLLQKKSVLLDSLSYLLASPHCLHERKEVYKTIDQVTYVDFNIIKDILCHQQLYKQAGGIISGSYNPAEVLQYNFDDTIDTPENRFIKFFLTELQDLINQINDEYKNFQWLCSQMNMLSQELEYILCSDFFAQVGSMSLFPANSQVLMKKNGYKELFEIYCLLQQSHIPATFSKMEDCLPLKDMSVLWEYYVLCLIIEEMTSLFGEVKEIKVEQKTDLSNKLYEQVTYIFSEGITLHCQKSYKTYAGITFRPDFYIEAEHLNIILDAKFRLINNNKEDIFKNMHYYKDGLKVEKVIAVCFPERASDSLVGEFFSEKSNHSPLNLTKIANLLEQDNHQGIGYIDAKVQVI